MLIKNRIPVHCPGLTDGSLGDMLYFHSYRNPGLVVDIVQDIRGMNGEAVHAGNRKAGMVILGAGLPKHHICNAMMMWNGEDFTVYVNAGQVFDGSDSGASPDEAVSWGKIRSSAKSVKVHCDATIAETFAKRVKEACWNFLFPRISMHSRPSYSVCFLHQQQEEHKNRRRKPEKQNIVDGLDATTPTKPESLLKIAARDRRAEEFACCLQADEVWVWNKVLHILENLTVVS